MNCECNNKSNRVKPGIKHVYGNVLRMAIPLTLRTLEKDGDVMNVTDTDFIPSSDHPVRVVFSRGKTNYPIIATMDGNVAIVEDKGKIPVGTYDISVECYDDLGNPYRFKQNAVLYVADTTAEAGIDEEIEYEAQTWYLNAAVFLATTEIGEIGDVIDAKLDDVFGNVAYDANAKEIRFYNKDNSRVLATIDSRPFIADGTVDDVYIDVSRQVLVVVLNEDAGGTRFSVPLYLIFNSYYKKDEVDSLMSRAVEGLRFDFSQELPLVVPVTKNGSSYSSPVDFSAIDNAIREDGRLVVACVNDSEFYQLLDANRAEVSFSQVNALDGYQELLIVDKHNVWSMEDVDLGTGGGGGYEPPAGGIPKTDLAPAVQTSLAKADSALQPSDLEGYATTDDVDNAVATLVSSAPQTLDTLKELADALGDDPNFATTMATQLGNKVDKETGKGLSTNDYTTAEKTKLAGIAACAEVNVQADWNQTTTTADDYIKNKPTIPSKTSDLTNDSGFIDKSVYAGTCTTAAATMPKVCTVDTFRTIESNGVTHAADGTMIAVTFTNSDTNTSAAPTLNVNGIGAKAIMYNNAIVTSTAKNTIVAGTAKTMAYYYYDSSLDGGDGAWVYMGKSVDTNSTYSNASLGQGYATQSNSSAATAITASISSYALSAGGIVTIEFTYDVPANATLNISSKGAKAIYNQGAPITAGVIKAGDTATFIYSTYYHLIAVDSWQDKQDAISDLATIRSGAAAGATALQSHQPLKTINGQSLVGSGNITVVGEKGDKGDTGSVTVTDGLAQITIVNDLITGGTGDALSAEMGKRLALLAGTYAEAWARSKAITSPFCWLWVETVNGAAISKPIWHKGNSVFVDATGAIINVPAASVPDAPTITGASNGSTVPKNTQITITPASGSALYYSIDGGNTYQTSDSAVTLTLATAGSVSIIAYCANNAGNSSSASLSVTVAGTAVPTFSQASGEVTRGGSVAISVPSGGELHYKVNSGAWQTASGNSVSVPITGATTIQAYNVQDGDTSSTITNNYTMAALAAPSFSVASGTELPVGSEVLLSAASGTTIYYTTNGSTPTTSSTQYTGTAIAVNADMTIKAIAVDQWGSSQVSTASYTVAIDHKLVFKIKLSGDNSTEYVPVSHQNIPGFSSKNYTMSVDWGDGTVDNFADKMFNQKECSHAYTGAAGDEKTITLRGSAIPALYFGGSATGVGANAYGNVDALVAILENTLTCDTYISINSGCSSLSPDALSNNVGTGRLNFEGITSFPTGLLSHLSKTGISDFSDMFHTSKAILTAENMQELRTSLASATSMQSMFYGFNGTCPLPDNLFDLIGNGVVTSVWALMHTAKSGLTGDAKALYDVLSTKVTSSASTANCFTPVSLTNRDQVPNAWGGTAG